MIKAYPTLFQISLQHAFYADGRAKDLVLAPTPATQHLMRQYDMLWGEHSYTYTMVYGHETGCDAKLTYLKVQEPVILRFILRSTSPYFLHITDLPFFQPGETLLYLDNITGLQPVSENVSKSDLLPVYGSSFRVKSILALRNAQHQDLGQMDEDKKHYWTPVDRANLSLGYQVDLQTFAPGKYGYDTAPGQTTWFYYAGSEIRPGDLGVVDIYLGRGSDTMVSPPAISIDSALSNDPRLIINPVSVPNFQIAFGNRETFWRYYVIDKNNLAPDSMMVDDGTRFTVDDQSEDMRSGVHQAKLFISNTAIGIKERPTEKLRLKLIKTKVVNELNGTMTTLDLPTPDWRHISAEKGGEKVYSDMYIYL